jgi:hypothetical protein
MTEPTPEAPRDADEAVREREAVPEPEVMPRWVPVVIGLVLVTLAALAVATGLRFREDGFVRVTQSQPDAQQRPSAYAPSGEPAAGGSLVLSDDHVPTAKEAVTGPSRAVISGGPGGVEGTVRIWARRGMIVTGAPAEALVYVNQTLVGPAKQLDTQDEIYDFPEPGSYTVRVTAPGFRDRQFVVTAAEDAKDDVAVIEARLAPGK